MTCKPFLALVYLFVPISLILVSCSSSAVVFYDIPEGEAEQTLVDFASQSSIEIIYEIEDVANVRTRRIYGSYTLEDALQYMLADSLLQITVDEKSGAIAVNKKSSIARGFSSISWQNSDAKIL